MTALHWAAAHDDRDLAALLIKGGASPAALTRIGRYTPLHIAAKEGHGAIVRLLADAHADVRGLTTTGAAPLHFAAASGSNRGHYRADRSRRRRERARAAVVADAVDVRRSQRPHRRRAHADGPRADVAAVASVVDISARNREDGAQSRERNARIAAIQREMAAKAAASGTPAPGAAARTRPDNQDGNEPEPLGYGRSRRAQGGRTALLLASREGLDETAFALIDGGANINQVSASDHTSPLLMATINGHFDLAMKLMARGANVTTESDAGAHAALRRAQHAVGAQGAASAAGDYMQQKTGYLEIAEALLKAGADPNVGCASRSGTRPTTAISWASIAAARRRSGSPPTPSTSRR
jgi:ankyrin repeat protein